ncbi:MAG: LamG domain-containing protein [Planctomycetes bacterium]|nr:LamG domain-containing protein [Planctomycetota bacterium]
MANKTTTAVGFLLLGAMGGLSFMLPEKLTLRTAVSQSLPAAIPIQGVVRDFRMTHPDFDLSTSAHEGAGSVRLKLGFNGVPASESVISSHGSDDALGVIDTASSWSFDDGSGTTAVDSKGIQNGTLMNDPAWFSSGRIGQALRFDGVDDYVAVAHDPAYLMDEASFAFWFNADDTTTRQVLVAKNADGYGTGGHVTCLVESDRIQVVLRSTTASYTAESPPDSIAVGAWHHVAFSFGSNGMLLFLDSELVDFDPYTGGLGTSSGGTGNTQPWSIGAGHLGSGGTVLDQFNAVSYGNDDGSGSWSSPWEELNDDGTAAAGTAFVQSNLLHVDNSDSGLGPIMTRKVNLAGAATATLAFDYGGYGTGPVDTFAVEASDDGGATWTVLESINLIKHVTSSRSYDLQSFISLTADG